MKSKTILLTVILLGSSLAFTGCKERKSESDLALITRDETGEKIVKYVPKNYFIRKTSKLFKKIYEKSFDQLNSMPIMMNDHNFVLKRVSVGLQVVFEFKFTSLWKHEYEPSFELRFERLSRGKI